MTWVNPQTKVVFQALLDEMADLADVIDEWQEVLGPDGDIVTAFGRQLDQDVHDDPPTRLLAVALSKFLERVSWVQVAARLVQYVNERQSQPLIVCAKRLDGKPLR